MLSIKAIGSSSSEVSYYARLGSEDYYVKGGEPPGAWWGSGAESLGLEGKVSGKDLGNLLRGYSPDGKLALVQNAGKQKRRSAFDLTWTVPKSVSVAWSQESLEGRLAIEQAGERALSRVLALVQDFCGVTRRGHGGGTIETARLAAGVFRHETARAVNGELPDPNLHWHVVLLNLSVREDGTTGALDGRALFTPHMKMALGALFRSELARELTDIGYSCFRPMRNGKIASWFEIDAVPEEMLEAFSKRRKEIEKWLLERGLSGAKAAEKAANQTKHAKENVAREELLSAWKEAGQKLGYRGRNAERTPKSKPELNLEAVEAVAAQITDGTSHFSRTELLRRVAEAYQASGAGIDSIVRAVDGALLSSKELVPLSERRGELRYTTREMLQIEAELLADVERAKGSGRPLSIHAVTKATSDAATLTGQQREAVRHLTRGSNRIACVSGMAGTGKTFMLGVTRKAFENAGFSVLGTTLAAKASEALEEGSGIRSLHIHRLLKQLDSGREKLGPKSVLVVDEAGMVGTRMMQKLVAMTEKTGSKLLLVGDARQLQAIDAGGPFAAICDRLGSASLTEITRQRDSWARDAVKEMAAGDAGSSLARFKEHGLLTVSSDRKSAMEALVGSWATDDQRLKSLIFAGTRLETTVLNRLCQQWRIENGDLGSESIEVKGNMLYVGDRVTFTRNNASLLVRNGNFGTVVGVDSERQELRVELDSGYRVCISLESYDDLALAYGVTTHKGQGQTVESAYVLAGGAMTDRELSYVQTSRARGKTHIFTDEVSSGERLEQLARQMSTSRAKDLAHDYLIEAA